MYQSLRKAIGELAEADRPELKPTTNLVESLRVIKEPGEIEALQAAVTLGDAAFEHVAERIEPGWTEKQVAWEIEKYAREHGGEGLSFDTIVAAGPWGAMPHAQPRDHVIEKGEGVVIDMGVKLNGYVSDLTRTIFVGKAGRAVQKIYDIVLGAQLTAEELVRPGMTGGEAHMLAAKVIEEAGYGDKFGHGLGHGVGLQVHEPPRVSTHLRRRARGRHGLHRRARYLPAGLGRRPHRGPGLPQGRPLRPDVPRDQVEVQRLAHQYLRRERAGCR